MKNQRLFAGIDDGLYEYAIWATTRSAAAAMLGSRFLLGELADQSDNKALKQICSDKSKIYRRDLGHDENPWETEAANA